jgi:putative molybdopterin biosynthesis protein
MNPAAANSEVLTVKEISDLLRLRPSTVYKMIRQGRIPCFRSDQIGNDWRFRKDVIERWIGGL